MSSECGFPSHFSRLIFSRRFVGPHAATRRELDAVRLSDVDDDHRRVCRFALHDVTEFNAISSCMCVRAIAWNASTSQWWRLLRNGNPFSYVCPLLNDVVDAAAEGDTHSGNYERIRDIHVSKNACAFSPIRAFEILGEILRNLLFAPPVVRTIDDGKRQRKQAENSDKKTACKVDNLAEEEEEGEKEEFRVFGGVHCIGRHTLTIERNTIIKLMRSSSDIAVSPSFRRHCERTEWGMSRENVLFTCSVGRTHNAAQTAHHIKNTQPLSKRRRPMLSSVTPISQMKFRLSAVGCVNNETSE